MFNANEYYNTDKQLFTFTNGFKQLVGLFDKVGENGRVWMTPLKKGGRKAPKICVKMNTVKAVK